jgi:hypothetical protein
MLSKDDKISSLRIPVHADHDSGGMPTGIPI